MQNEMPFFEGPEDALREAVRAMGGPKKVGPMLWPDKQIDAAARLLSDCLNTGREEKLHLSQALLILRSARDAGYHAAFMWVASEIGYDAKPISPAEEIDRVTSVVEQTTATLTNALAALERLQAGNLRRVS
jgi:hypothetical protein